MKPSEILKTIKKTQWTKGKYSDENNSRFCFNGFILNEVLGYPEPKNGDLDKEKVYGIGYDLIHDIITDINDNDRVDNFTTRKNLAIAFLKRENL